MIASGAGFNNPNSHLRSMQTGTIDLNGVTTNTATISSVDVTTTLLEFLGFNVGVGGSLNGQHFPRLALTNATTVTAVSNVNTATARLVGYAVREFYSGVFKSAPQYGTVTLNGVVSNTATVSSVDTTKAMAGQTGFSYNSAGNNETNFYAKTRLTNATTVTVTTGTAPGFDVIAAYRVEEWN